MLFLLRLLCICFVSTVLLSSFSHSTDNTSPIREFRGAWIATVINLDWPDSRLDSPANQKKQLVTMLDELQKSGINAVMFQVRTECDALYDSPYEPWSYWLTGEQGTPPEPFYDPLEFAIEEAHKRGMEIHAWFNPYRAERAIGNYDLAENHVINKHPEWILTFDQINQNILDPGLPEVREYVVDIIMDVVERYNIDGVHMDDYFYPYPDNRVDFGGITDEDDSTFAEHHRGFTDRGDWRRDNINLLIDDIYSSINEIKPYVKFGMSPFGIWKNGVPSGTSGLDAYNVIYADPVAWLEEETVDYIVPQLYWPFGGGQDYGTLALWWESVRNERDFYPGHGVYKSDGNTFYDPSQYSADEVPRQIRFNREHDGINGSVFFRAHNITKYHSKGFADSLQNDLYYYPSIIPSLAWKDSLYAPFDPPDDFTHTWIDEQTIEFEWNAPSPPEFGDDLVRYAVYRIHSDSPPVLPDDLDYGKHLLSVQADRWLVDSPPYSDDPYYYVVTSLNRNHNQSEPSDYIMLDVTSAPDVDDLIASYSLSQNYPNPFNPETNIRFTIPHSERVTLTVYDMLGREVEVLVDESMYAGQHTIRFDASHLPSGVYIYRIKAGEFTESKRMIFAK